MKRLTALLLLFAIMFCLSSCKNGAKDHELGNTPSEVFKFKELPDEYTPEEALLDGCLVLQWDEGATTPRVRGYDYWQTFLNTCRRGEKISLRVVYFTSGNFWFQDVYYTSNGFYVYTRDVYSENQIGPFKYLTQINGKDPDTKEKVDFFVLTDDAELGAEDVLSIKRICDIEAERYINFTVVDFTTYF